MNLKGFRVFYITPTIPQSPTPPQYKFWPVQRGMPFRCHSKTFLLTYSRCDVTKESMFEHLLGLIGNRFEYLVVAHELHEDGGDHLHAFFTVKVIYARCAQLTGGGRRYSRDPI